MDTNQEQLRPDGLTWVLTFPSGADAPPDAARWHWLHFDMVNAKARALVEADAALTPLARQVLAGTDETVRIVTDAHAIAGVLPGYARTGVLEEHEIVGWHFAVVPGRVVTGRKHASRTLANVYTALQGGGMVSHSPLAIVDLCLTDFARDARGRLAGLARRLDAVEDALLEGREVSRLQNFTGPLGAVRREVAQLKRVLAPVARALDEDVAEDMPDWANTQEHGGAYRAVMGALDDIAALQERAHALQDELNTRLTEETNRRLYIVSLVTMLVMPATLVTGFFGMNTGGLPWGGDAAAHGTIFAAAVCLGSVLATLGLLRWKRLL